MNTMGSCSTDRTETELNGFASDTEAIQSFEEEYSVRVEVYETEVTGSCSAGSAPIIKITGLCDSGDIGHGSSPPRRLPTDQEKTVAGCSQALPQHSKSLHIFQPRHQYGWRTPATVSASCVSWNTHRSHTALLVPFGDCKENPRMFGIAQDVSEDDKVTKRTHSVLSIVSKRRISSGCVHVNQVVRQVVSIDGRALRNPDEVPLTLDEELVSVRHSIGPATKASKSQASSGVSVRTMNSHPRFTDYIRKDTRTMPVYRTRKLHSLRSSSSRNTPVRSRKWTTIPTVMMESHKKGPREGRTKRSKGSSGRRTYLLSKPPRTNNRDAFGLIPVWCSNTSIDCIEETVTTTQLFPAANPANSYDTRKGMSKSTKVVSHYVYDNIDSSPREAWASTDLSAVYKILPPREHLRGNWSPLRVVTELKCVESTLPEVYITPPEIYQKTGTLIEEADQHQRRDVYTHFASVSASREGTFTVSQEKTPGHADKETQTSSSTLSLPNVLNSLVEWVSQTCQSFVARIANAPAEPTAARSLQDLFETDSSAWWKVAKQIHDGITGFTQQQATAERGGGACSEIALSSKSKAGGGEEYLGGCDRRVEQLRSRHKGLPRRLSSRLDLSAGISQRMATVNDVSDIRHHCSCPSFYL